MQSFVTPRALETVEVPGLVRQFQRGAELARLAGFDGVEVHGGNGYLIDQFLRDGSNCRADEYGGTTENRMRLLHEVLEAVTEVYPTQRVGVRLTPENSFNSMYDSDPQAHFGYFFEQLNSHRVAYVHVVEGDMITRSRGRVDYRALKRKFTGAYLANNGYDLARATSALNAGAAELISFGVPFLANPDLVRRYRENLPLNVADTTTFYTGGETGYDDYPTYAALEAAA